jgi:hypothetical protein
MTRLTAWEVPLTETLRPQTRRAAIAAVLTAAWASASKAAAALPAPTGDIHDFDYCEGD